MLIRYLVASLLITTVTPIVGAAELFNPENGHYYRTLSPLSASWVYAKLFAFQQVKDGQRGHLVTITSASEQAFVVNNVPTGSGIWTGGFQPAGSPEPAGNWQWITGEPFEYTNWPSGYEPNNYGDEFVLEIAPGETYWNDTHLGSASQPFKRRWIAEFTPGYAPALDGADFLNWQRTLHKRSYPPDGIYQLGDFDGDQLVDGDDLAIWKSYFGGGAQSSTPVPEASATLLAILGALCTATMCRSQR
jgi:hypothetical protein